MGADQDMCATISDGSISGNLMKLISRIARVFFVACMP